MHAAVAAEVPMIHGDYVGMLGPLHLRLHISAAPDGTLSGTLDSPDQGAAGIPCADFHVEGPAFSFTVPSVHGTWHGSIESSGATLSGTWSQGTPLPLTFTRDDYVPATTPSAVDGYWLGTLHGPQQDLRIQLSIKSDNVGREFCTLDSLDQGAFGLTCANVAFSSSSLSFDVPSVRGHWSGNLSDDRNSLSGTWAQGGALPLRFERQTTLQQPRPPPKISYDPAMPPVDAAHMRSVVREDLRGALESGALAPATSAGVTIGVVRDVVRSVFAFGSAKPDSIFEIGSITKTFTGLLLAQMVEQRKVTLDEPVRELLPPGKVTKPAGPEITLLDLITHHSGLPRMPDNFQPTDPTNPYADYDASNLYAFLAKHGVAKPADAPFLYSNLGAGLLGQALADRAGTSYATLIAEEITGPLGMPNTVVSLSAAQQPELIQGHTAQHRPMRAWDFRALAGAGSLRSTAADMLTYLQANLQPKKLTEPLHETTDARTLSAALMMSHQPRADAGPAMRIAFAWLYDPATGDYWHNGATGGYSSYAFFNPKGNYGGVVLLNTTISPRGSFADVLGRHISQRFEGKPAISLASW